MKEAVLLHSLHGAMVVAKVTSLDNAVVALLD